MLITQKPIPINTLRRSGQKILGVKFIVAHDTGNDNSTAQQNVDYYIKSANDEESSAHAFVDDKGVIECIPLTEKAWHVQRQAPKDNELFGLDSNDYALGIELCYSTSSVFDTRQAYSNYIEYIKGLCKSFNIDPSTHVIGHYTLDPTRRTDPINAFKTIGKAWDDFIKDLTSIPADDRKANLLKRVEELKQLILSL